MRETNPPAIIQAFRGARKYANDRFLYRLMRAATQLYPEIPVALHQDHGNSPETCKSAIELGFTSVMIGGSLKEETRCGISHADSLRAILSPLPFVVGPL